MQTIKPTFGDLPEVPKESEQTSGSGLLTTVAVVGAGVVMAAAGYFFLGTGGKRKKKKKKKKKKGGNSGAAGAKGGASAKAKKASQPLTAAAARKKNAAPAPPRAAANPGFQAGFLNSLTGGAQSPIRRDTPIPTTQANEFFAHKGWQKVELAFLTGDSKQALQHFVACMNLQKINYFKDTAKVGRRDFTANGLFQKCIEFFTFPNPYRLANTAFAHANHKYFSDLRAGKKVDPDMMPATKYLCGFCSAQLGDLKACQKLGWTSRSTRLATGNQTPVKGSLLALRMTREAKTTKVMIANAMPRQRAFRLAQAAQIAKMEVRLVKDVHGEESQEYLDAIISASKLSLQCTGISGATAEYTEQLLAEASKHPLFEKKTGQERGMTTVLHAMSSLMAGNTDAAVQIMLESIETFKSLETEKASETDRRNFFFFVISLVSKGKMCSAKQVAEAALGLPNPTGKRALLTAYSDAIESLEQSLVFCNGAESVDGHDLDAKIEAGSEALQNLGGSRAVPTDRRAIFTMYPECYDALGYKSVKISRVAARLQIEAITAHSRSDFMSSARACRILIKLAPVESTDSSVNDALLSTARRLLAKVALCLIGSSDTGVEKMLEEAATAANQELEAETLESVAGSNGNDAVSRVGTPAAQIKDPESVKLSRVMELNAQLGTIKASFGNGVAAASHFKESMRGLIALKEIKSGLATPLKVADIRKQTSKYLAKLCAWVSMDDADTKVAVTELVQVAKEALSAYDNPEEVEESTKTINFAYAFMYHHSDAECKATLDAAHFETVENKANTPASRFAWALLAEAAACAKHKQDRAACLYGTLAMDVGTQLFSPTRKELWGQVLQIWVPTLFAAGVETMAKCGVTQAKIEFATNVLKKLKIATVDTINQLCELAVKLGKLREVGEPTKDTPLAEE